jgi:CPA1 family monovalent cation:H+ antiporter
MHRQLEQRLERYRRRLDLLEKSDSDQVPSSPQYEAALMVRRAVIDAQREELLRWRDAGRLNDDGLRVLERELDHEELLLPKRPGG